MPDAFAESLERVNSELGRKALSPCYEVFLFGTAPRRDFRDGVLAAIDALKRDGSLGWYKTSTMKLPKKVGTNPQEIAANFLETIEAKPPKLAGIHFHSGADKETFGLPSVTFMSETLAGKPQTRTYIRVCVPPTLSDGSAGLRLFARPIVGKVPVVTGYAGWSFYWSDVDPQEERIVRAHGPAWLARFPGLSYGAPLSYLQLIGDDLLGISWLTYVGKAAAEARQQTLADVAARLKKQGVSAAMIDGSVLEVQAGPEPALGDRNRNNLLPEYQRVGKALSFMKLDDDKAGYLAILGMDQERRREWFNRFFGTS